MLIAATEHSPVLQQNPAVRRSCCSGGRRRRGGSALSTGSGGTSTVPASLRPTLLGRGVRQMYTACTVRLAQAVDAPFLRDPARLRLRGDRRLVSSLFVGCSRTFARARRAPPALTACLRRHDTTNAGDGSVLRSRERQTRGCGASSAIGGAATAFKRTSGTGASRAASWGRCGASPTRPSRKPDRHHGVPRTRSTARTTTATESIRTARPRW